MENFIRLFFINYIIFYKYTVLMYYSKFYEFTFSKLNAYVWWGVNGFLGVHSQSCQDVI